LRVDWIPNRYGVIKDYENEKQQLAQYLKLYNKKSNAFKVEYKKCKHGWGRLLVKDALGCTAFCKKTRNTLLRDLYMDFDLKNAQPDIIRNVCHINKIDCPIIDRYCNERDEILNEISKAYNTDKKNAKKLILRLCFFGSFEGWKNELNLAGNATPFITEFKNELIKIAHEIKKSNKDLYDTARKLKEQKDEKNFIGSMFALYCQG
jgi:hypothetical protein